MDKIQQSVTLAQVLSILRFYASSENWRNMQDGYEEALETSKAAEDKGRKARQLLKQLKKEQRA